jgi:hypothetical protein
VSDGPDPRLRLVLSVFEYPFEQEVECESNVLALDSLPCSIATRQAPRAHAAGHLALLHLAELAFPVLLFRRLVLTVRVGDRTNCATAILVECLDASPFLWGLLLQGKLLIVFVIAEEAVDEVQLPGLDGAYEHLFVDLDLVLRHNDTSKGCVRQTRLTLQSSPL